MCVCVCVCVCVRAPVWGMSFGENMLKIRGWPKRGEEKLEKKRRKKHMDTSTKIVIKRGGTLTEQINRSSHERHR